MLLKVEMDLSMDWDKLFTSLLEKCGFLCVVFGSTVAMNFTQLIVQQCFKTITGTGMTFQGFHI